MTERPNSLRVLNGMPAVTALNRKKTALLMIDFQMESFTGLLPAAETEKLAEKAVRLMDWADRHKIKTLHMQRAARSPASPPKYSTQKMITFIMTEKGQSKRYPFALPYISSNYVELLFTSNVSISTSTVHIP